MIVDVHVHPPRHRVAVADTGAPRSLPWRPDQAVNLRQTYADFEREFEGIDALIAFNIATYPPTESDEPKSAYDTIFGPTPGINDAVAEFAAAYSSRVIGFLSVHPDDPNAQAEIRRCVHELGLKGVKLGLNYQKAELLGENAYAVYATAEKMGLPILFHMGTSPVQFAPLEYAYPLYVDRIAIAFPNRKIIMAHMGHPWQTDTIVVIRKHPNVYADVSALFYRPWSMYNALRLATEWSVLHKLLFGSDYPIASPHETIDGLRGVNAILEGTKLPRVPEDELEAIIHRDSLSLLGLNR